MNHPIYLNTQGKHTLVINGKDVLLYTNFSVIGLFVFEHEVIIITDDMDLHNTSVADSYRENRQGNMIAFTTQGELLWTYDDIAHDPLHFPFSGGYVANDDNKAFFANYFQIEFDPNHAYFVATDNAEGHTIIDVTANKWLARVAYRT